MFVAVMESRPHHPRPRLRLHHPRPRPFKTETTPSKTKTFKIRDRDPIFFMSNIFLHKKHHFFTGNIFLHEKHHFLTGILECTADRVFFSCLYFHFFLLQVSRQTSITALNPPPPTHTPCCVPFNFNSERSL